MFIWVTAIIGGFFLILAGYIYFSQSRLVFYPTREIAAEPSDVGLAFEDVWIPKSGGEKLHGWMITPDSTENDYPVVLFSHGNAGNISHRLETAHFINGLGAGILLYDYSGYGKSGGEPSEKGMYSDIRACFDWLVSEKGITPDRIVLFGRSLGGVPSIHLAAERNCRGLVVESSLTSAHEMGKLMFPYMPVSLLIRYDMNSLARITQVRQPVVVAHSPNDEMIPFSMGERLFEAAPKPKRLVKLIGGHNERDYFSDQEYVDALKWILFSKSEQREN